MCAVKVQTQNQSMISPTFIRVITRTANMTELLQDPRLPLMTSTVRCSQMTPQLMSIWSDPVLFAPEEISTKVSIILKPLFDSHEKWFYVMMSVWLSTGRPAHRVQYLNIGLFFVTVYVINVKLSMIVVVIELYLFIPFSRPLPHEILM